MPKFTYQPNESKYDVPEGVYRVKFVRSKERPPFEGPSKYPQSSNEPRLEWEFEVMDGEEKGKVIAQTTGSNPGNPKSNCYKVLKWLLGRSPQAGEPIDTDQFVDCRYELTWELNPDSPSGNCRIGHMKFLANAPSQATLSSPFPKPAQAPQTAQTARKGPPPMPPKPAPAPQAEPEGTFYAQETGEQPYTYRELQTWISANGRDVRTLQVAREGESVWKPAETFGFTDLVPY